MNTAKQLYELQEIDLEIESGEQSLAPKTGQLGDKRVLDQTQNRLNEAKQKLDELKRRQRDAEGEMDDLEIKIKEAENQLYGGKIMNPKELSGLQHEITTMKARNDQLETKALEVIERVESAEKDFAAATGEYKETETTWQKQQQQLAADIQQLKNRLAELGQQRRQLAGDVEPEAVGLYEKIRQHKRPPVARVEQGICRACRITLSASEVQRVRSGQPIQCGSCGRILFLA